MHILMRCFYSVISCKRVDANREPRQREGDGTDPNNEVRQANTQSARVQILMTKCTLYYYSSNLKFHIMFASLFTQMCFMYAPITRTGLEHALFE